VSLNHDVCQGSVNPWSPTTTTGVTALDKLDPLLPLFSAQVLPTDGHVRKWTSTAPHRTAHGQRYRSRSGFWSSPRLRPRVTAVEMQVPLSRRLSYRETVTY
jgi:hypothetical protein